MGSSNDVEGDTAHIPAGATCWIARLCFTSSNFADNHILWLVQLVKSKILPNSWGTRTFLRTISSVSLCCELLVYVLDPIFFCGATCPQPYSRLCFTSFAQQKAYPGKVPQSEEEATKDPVIRKSIKEAAAEVEKSEGRGQLKVTLSISDTKVNDLSISNHVKVLSRRFPAFRWFWRNLVRFMPSKDFVSYSGETFYKGPWFGNVDISNSLLFLVSAASAVPKARPPPQMNPKMIPASGKLRKFNLDL